MNNCEIYKKHHNTIDGIYMLRLPSTWEEIPHIDEIDAEDEDGTLYLLFRDSIVYDIEDLDDFESPTDKHNIKESIFIIRRLGEYYLCETQGENYIKFATNISNIDFIELYDRGGKISKLQETTTNKYEL